MRPGPNDGPMSESEAIATGHRMKATDAMRAKAKILEERSKRILRESNEWHQLADVLDEIERSAKREDGNEAAPHVGVGSGAENLLWKLASDYQEKS